MKVRVAVSARSVVLVPRTAGGPPKEETPVAMHFRDARILRIGGGTDEVQLEILAKRMNL